MVPDLALPKKPRLKLLFVCSRNKWRSPTAEAIYRHRQGLSVRSAGTEPSARFRVSSKDIAWADTIFVMEKKHKQRLLTNFPGETTNKKVVILYIEDDYKYMDEELVEMIKQSVEPYL